MKNPFVKDLMSRIRKNDNVVMMLTKERCNGMSGAAIMAAFDIDKNRLAFSVKDLIKAVEKKENKGKTLYLLDESSHWRKGDKE